MKILNESAAFYDLPNLKDSLHYKLKKDSTHEFGKQYIAKTPSEQEVQFIANRHITCEYYSLGLLQCKMRVLQAGLDNFLICKDTLDAMYRCYTDNKLEETYDDVGKANMYADKFKDCLFRKHSTLTNCMEHFEDSIRVKFREEGSTLENLY